jgi:hypothetical protein
VVDSAGPCVHHVTDTCYWSLGDHARWHTDDEESCGGWIGRGEGSGAERTCSQVAEREGGTGGYRRRECQTSEEDSGNAGGMGCRVMG